MRPSWLDHSNPTPQAFASLRQSCDWHRSAPSRGFRPELSTIPSISFNHYLFRLCARLVSTKSLQQHTLTPGRPSCTPSRLRGKPPLGNPVPRSLLSVSGCQGAIPVAGHPTRGAEAVDSLRFGIATFASDARESVGGSPFESSSRQDPLPSFFSTPFPPSIPLIQGGSKKSRALWRGPRRFTCSIPVDQPPPPPLGSGIGLPGSVRCGREVSMIGFIAFGRIASSPFSADRATFA